MGGPTNIFDQLRQKLGQNALKLQHTADEISTCWIARENAHDALLYLREEVDRPYRMLYDLTAIDERMRTHREGQPASDFTIVYHLLSFDRNEYLRIKVALKSGQPPIDTATDLWPVANWCEHEVWGMFGIRFQGHPHLERMLTRSVEKSEFRYRDPGKMGEQQSWESDVPYTNLDALGGVVSKMAYLMAAEKLAAIEVPPRAKVIRVMLAEVFRIISHLDWYQTLTHDLQLSPVVSTLNDRNRAFPIVEAVCGPWMHRWLRFGGVANDLPKGWDTLVHDFLKYLPPRLIEYNKDFMQNRSFKAKTRGVGAFTTEEAIDWGVTGPNLRASGFEWDFRKKQPYSGYEQFEFDIPTGRHGDCYDCGLVRIEEMRQSLHIIEQCANNMPEGAYKSAIHSEEVSGASAVPPGEALGAIEAANGNNGYYVVGDGSTALYRTRIVTPFFAHMQILPQLIRGRTVPDLLATLAAMDFALADVER